MANLLLQQGGGGSLFILFFVVALLFSLVVSAVWLFASYWVYEDAESRGESGALWGVVVFFGGVLGIAIYFLAVRE